MLRCNQIVRLENKFIKVIFSAAVVALGIKVIDVCSEAARLVTGLRTAQVNSKMFCG